MPIVKKPDGWYWGSKGPFATKQKAAQVGAAAHAAGFKEEIMDKDHASEFVLTMLHSVTNAHIMHFQTRSYARHVALQAYYEGIGDIVDDFVEAYQGRYDVITYFNPSFNMAQDPLTYFKGLLSYIDECRKELPQDSELQNIVDEMTQLIDSTLYKLEFLS